jgi:hypothetical protein
MPGEGFIVDLPERQEAAGGMEGQGGNAAKAAKGVGRMPDCRPLARAESPKRSAKSSERGRVNPRSKMTIFGEGEKVCSRGLKKEYFSSPDTRQARFQCPIALFPKKRISFLTKAKDSKKGNS